MSRTTPVSRTVSPRKLNFHTSISRSPARSIAEENLKKPIKSKTANLNILQPQRIELPLYFNTPRRFEEISPGKHRPQHAEDLSLMVGASMDRETRNSTLKRLNDYRLLAEACQRAGKTKDQGRAYYSMGVLFDNLGLHMKAIKAYEKFLNVCKTIKDLNGEALAYNCIGVDYHKLAEAENNRDLWEQAIKYHTLHRDIADTSGRFLSHINLGIVYDRIGETEKSAVNHQFALRYAIQLSSVSGQTVAIGNLGQIGSKSIKGDFDRMKVFVERYLNLSNDLRDKKGVSGAYHQLGAISYSLGDYESSTRNYYRAMRVADEAGERDLKDSARCRLGIANGMKKMDDLKSSILEKLKAK